MANESRSISGAVHVEQGGPTQVAFHLMGKIAENTYKEGMVRDEKYWLGLYRKCWKAANGHNLKSILEDESQAR